MPGPKGACDTPGHELWQRPGGDVEAERTGRRRTPQGGIGRAEPESGQSWGRGLTAGWVLGGPGQRGSLTRVRLRTNRSSTSWRTWSWFLSRNLCTWRGGGEGQFGVDPTLPQRLGRQGGRLTHPRVCAPPAPLLLTVGQGLMAPGDPGPALQASVSLSVLRGTGPSACYGSRLPVPLSSPLPGERERGQ